MLSAAYRFHGRRALGFLFREGKSARRKMVSLKYTHRPHRTASRCAVVVGRKVSKSAPVRNRIRRRIYELVRLNWDKVSPGMDMAFFVYDSSVAEMPPEELAAIIEGLLDDASQATLPPK